MGYLLVFREDVWRFAE